MFGNCHKTITASKQTLRDRNSASSECRLRNESCLAFTLVSIDGCMNINGRKCDYLVEPKVGVGIFIELKGKDVAYAIEQIVNTLSHLKSIGYRFTKLYAAIVSSRVPLTSIELTKKQDALWRKHSCLLIVKNNVLVLDLDKYR